MSQTRKSRNAQIGHIKRKLNKGEPLSGELLELAISVVPDETIIKVMGKKYEPCREIVQKLRNGLSLDEYELHLMCDMWLVHVQLG